MAVASKSRRGKGATDKKKGSASAKGKATAAKSAKSNGGEKLSIANKRLSHASPGDRRKAVKMAKAGDSVAEIAEFLGVTPVKAKFLVMQQQVEDGDVPRVKTDDASIIKALKGSGNFTSVAWVAARTGLSGGKITQVARDAGIGFERGRPASDAPAKKSKGTTASRGKGKAEAAEKKSGTRARRGKAVEAKSEAKGKSKGKRTHSKRNKAVNPNA